MPTPPDHAAAPRAGRLDPVPGPPGLVSGFLLAGLGIAAIFLGAAQPSLRPGVGAALAIAGAVEIIRGMRARRAGGTSMHVGVGSAYALAGLLLALAVRGPLGVALTLGAMLVTVAVMRLAAAATSRPRGKAVRHAAAGLLAAALAVAVLTAGPSAAPWTIGLAAGLELLAAGGLAIASGAAARPSSEDIIRGRPVSPPRPARAP